MSLTSSEPVLRVHGLCYAWPGQPPLFDGLSFTLPAGLVRLDADTGKTTLLRLLAGELHGEGRIEAAGPACWIDPRDPRWQALTPAQLAAGVRTRHPGFDEAAWQRHLAGFELLPHLDKTMHMLSTGSRRKVALAAALAAGATVTLLDEPTAGLDAAAVGWLQQALAARAGEPGRSWLLAAAWGLEDRLPWAGVLGWQSK